MGLVQARTQELTDQQVAELRRLCDGAFGERFNEKDWEHALGGMHFFLADDEGAYAHASVVPRKLEASGRFLETGYVEAVATHPHRQGQGHGSTVMRAAARHIFETYDLGALSTGENSFYERLGWERWRGKASVRTEQGTQRTPKEDGSIMVLLTPRSRGIDLRVPISCEWRTGDVW